MATYVEFLKSQGATDEDIKLLDTPVARKAYERMEAAIADKEAARVKAQQQAEGYQKWYNDEALPYVTGVESKLKVTEATLAGERARIKSLQDAGLLEVAVNDDAARAAAAAAATAGQPTFDPAKHNLVTTDILTQVAEREGDAIAVAQDIAAEHAYLFSGDPSKRLNFRELRKEAIAQKKPVETLWMEKYGVQAARDARSAADKAAYEKKVADDAIAAYKAAHPASSVNPALGTGVPSANPFTGKAPSSMGTASTDALPWQKSDTQKVNDRLSKVTSAHPEMFN